MTITPLDWAIVAAYFLFCTVIGLFFTKRGVFPLWLPGGVVTLPARAHALASRLSTMPSLRRSSLGRSAQPLLDAGILGPRDLPLRIIPKNPRALDGWRFA